MSFDVVKLKKIANPCGCVAMAFLDVK